MISFPFPEEATWVSATGTKEGFRAEEARRGVGSGVGAGAFSFEDSDFFGFLVFSTAGLDTDAGGRPRLVDVGETAL